MRILLTANTSWYLVNFRTSLVRSLIGQGHRVMFAAPRDEWSGALESLGEYYPLKHLAATGRNPLGDLRLLFEYRRVLSRCAPGLVLSFTAKSNIYAAFAAAGRGIRVIPTINGLGRGLAGRGAIAVTVGRLYNSALRSCPRVFVQNQDDRQFLVSRRILVPERVRVTPGSGIDLQAFAPGFGEAEDRKQDSPAPLKLLYIGRILPEKGIVELMDAVKRVRASGVAVELRIAGAVPDDAKAPLRERDLQAAHRRGECVYLGMVSDVRPHIARADAVVLPSYYPEGVPRALLEALALARPVITTDHPGCRETVNGHNGILVPPKDTDALAAAIGGLASLDPSERRTMGEAGRRIAVERFDERVVIGMYLEEINGNGEESPVRPSVGAQPGRGRSHILLSPGYRAFKRAIDLSLTTLAIATLSPVLVGTAAILKFTGEHSVIYRQVRVGEDFRPFHVFKFVTMRSNSERYGTITAKGDPRVLPVGRLLRRAKINELPQLFNVVLGSMSIVGPRPLVDSEVQTYPEHVRDVIYSGNRPGLTGMGSLFFREEEEIIAATGKKPSRAYKEDIMPVKGELELWYRGRRCPRLDAKIVLLTIWAVASPGTAPLERAFVKERGFPLGVLREYRRLCDLVHGGRHPDGAAITTPQEADEVVR